jgi:hypothetical protein
MINKSFKNKILLGITGTKDKDWQNKLKDLNRIGIREAALFLERFNEKQRKKIYHALLNSTIKKIPLCHIKNDMEKEELVFLENRFKTKYFTIHESSFSFLKKWPGFRKKLYLEMDTNNYVSQKVIVEKIGGFCVDLSHFKIALTDFIKEFDYTYFRKNKANFPCNHLNGYWKKENTDLHRIRSLRDFEYLKTLPKFVFGKIIGLEVDNSIKEQIKFREHLASLLYKYFKI